MTNKQIWFGKLEAGEKSSFVVRDYQLDSGDEKTICLYNQQRNMLVNYDRHIIEAKLVDTNLSTSEQTELETAYKKALKAAKPITFEMLYGDPTEIASPASRAAASQKVTRSADKEPELDLDEEDFDLGEEFA